MSKKGSIKSDNSTKDNNNIKDLMKIEYTYPEPDDDDFQNKVYTKREFYYHKIPGRDELKDYQDVKEYRDQICSRKFALQPQQSFLSNFINPDTPYKGALIFHGTGTGKTCAGIAIAERFKDMIKKYNTKIYVLVSGPLIKENWKSELLKCTGETYLKKHDESVYVSKAETNKAKKNALNVAMQYYRFMSYRSFYKKVLGEKIVEKVKTNDNKMKTVYRKTKEGNFERDIAIDRIYNLDNSLIIIDEAHNLTGNAYGEALLKIIKNSTNLKIVLLTATPMKNLAEDIIQLINFIRPQDSPLKREKIFTSEQYNHLIDFKPNGLRYLKEMSKGYVSYLRGADPLTFAKRVEKGTIPKGLLFTKVIQCTMKPFQKEVYDRVVSQLDDSLERKSEAVANFVFPGLGKDKKKILGYYGTEGISILKDQIQSYYDLLNKEIGKQVLKIKDEDVEDHIYLSEHNRISGNIMKYENLENFSVKFYTAFKNISKLVWGQKGAKTAFLYSKLVKVGIEVFQEILLQNGYLEYDDNPTNYKINSDTICYYCGHTYKEHQERKFKKTVMERIKKVEKTIQPPYHDFYPATFLSVTGGTSEESLDVIPEDKQQIILNVFNHIDNKEGKHIKFILGSQVMNEGISLKNVSEVHILDVYFNLGRVDQVIGRAIRHCSHYGVTNENNKYPEVTVYKYVVTVEKGLSTEEELYKKAEYK
jgi:superfamily II DNA or RNA helicase